MSVIGGVVGRAAAQDVVQSQTEKDALLRFCQQTDLSAPASVQGAKDRSDCWKRMQLEGMSDPVVDAKYQAAVSAYDAAVAADSVRRSRDSSTTAIDTRMKAVETAIRSRNLDDADNSVNDILAIQPQNQRALAFRDRITALKRARQLKITLFAIGAAVLVLAAGLGVFAKKLADRHTTTLTQRKADAANRKAMVKVVDGVGRGKFYPVENAVFRIGAAASDKVDERNDLVLSDSAGAISRFHCSIVRRDGRFYLIDSSLNGTDLNENPLERGEDHRLADGDEFTLASVARLKFLVM
jgi:hypothetical protein